MIVWIIKFCSTYLIPFAPCFVSRGKGNPDDSPGRGRGLKKQNTKRHPSPGGEGPGVRARGVIQPSNVTPLLGEGPGVRSQETERKTSPLSPGEVPGVRARDVVRAKQRHPSPLERGRGRGLKKRNAKRHPSPLERGRGRGLKNGTQNVTPHLGEGPGERSHETERKTSPLSRRRGAGGEGARRGTSKAPSPLSRRRGAGGEGARRRTSQAPSPLSLGEGPGERSQETSEKPYFSKHFIPLSLRGLGQSTQLIANQEYPCRSRDRRSHPSHDRRSLTLHTILNH